MPLMAFFTLSINAQNNAGFTQFNNIDANVNEFMKKWNITGGAVAITKNGKTIYNGGFGFSDAKHGTPTKANDLFRIASVSKPITSLAIMKLVEEGKLSLDDKVFGKGKLLEQAYYLEVINDPRLYSVTVQNLLEHTSGWNRNAPVDGYSHFDPAFFPLHVTETEQEPNPVGDSTLIRFSLRKGLQQNPGTKFSYSNVGYLVLGKIIEKVSGMKYETYVQKEIFDPLHVQDIRLGKNLPAKKEKREVEYIGSDREESCYGNGKKVPAQYGGFNVEAMNAHGGWIASAGDLTRLLSELDKETLLKSSTIKTMITPGASNINYAKGWQVNAKGNMWHTGSLEGTAAFVCKTADGYTWAFLFNSRADNSAGFWNELDRLPWKCVEILDKFVTVN
jgi:CubicO group peptidase (beta-lactamase class C family)